MNQNAHKPGSLPVPDADARAASEALVALVREDIAAAGGWLPFDRYMERVLYAPRLGYYSGGARKFGARAEDGSDFITAPELSPFFASTLARPVAQALAASGTRDLIEFGAGTGKLAAGLLNALDALGVAFDSYAIVELSGELRARQRETIEALAGDLAKRVRWLDALPETFAGVALGNEVLDAMPVKLFVRTGGAWHERGVALAADGKPSFADRRVAGSSGGTNGARDTETEGGCAADGIALAEYEAAVLAELDAQLDPSLDYVAETHAAAAAFTRTICTMLSRGAAFFVDYGFPRHEYYHPQRAQGTLMCHYRHHSHVDPFFYPGLQDITAHVEFTAIALAGTEAGADLLGYTSQARFLMNAGITDALAGLDVSDTSRFLPAANAVQKLLSEAEMGELFKVIAFSRGIDGTLDAFARGDRSHTL